MKITFLTPTLEIHGGNICMLKYADFLVKNHHQVTIIAPNKKNGLKINPKIRLLIYPKFKIKWVDFFTFQLVYYWKIKKLISECDFIIPIYTPLLIPTIVAKEEKKLKAKIVLLYQEPLEMLWVGPYNKFILSSPKIQKYLSGTIAVSKAIAEQFRKLTHKKAKIINNGIENEIFYDRKLPKKNYLLFVGRPNKPKGFNVFVKAFKNVQKIFPNLKAIAVSPNVEKKQIKNLKFILGNNREKLAKIYSQALIYVNPSYAESFGLTSLEAMASKTAVVLTNTQGAKEYAQNNKNCLVTPVGDANKLNQAIIKIIKNPSLRKKLEINGLKTASKFQWEKSAKEFLDYLNSLR